MIKCRGWLNKVKALFSQKNFKADYFEMLNKLKELEKQVGDRSEQLDLAKKSFLKNLYHEIRTPLNAIVGFNNLLSENRNLTLEMRKEYFNHINTSSAEFLKIMDEIIQASLLEAGMVNLEPVACKISEIIDETYSYCSLRKRVLKKDSVALLKGGAKDSEDVEIICDRYYLGQVLRQLVDNALKFTEMGVVEFGATINKCSVEFFVKDTGNGDLKGKEQFLFDRFTKVDISDGAKSGLGIGLSNVKNIVEMMDGKVWYNSVLNEGTCFYLSVPSKPVEIEASNIESRQNKFQESIIRGQNSLAI